MPRIEHICMICKKPFIAHTCAKRKFCSQQCYFVYQREILSKDPEWSKKISKIQKVVQNRPEMRAMRSITSKGRKCKDSTRKILSEMRKGEKNPYYGKKHPPEVRERIRINHLGEKNVNYGKPLCDNARKLLSEYRGEKTSNWKGGTSQLKDLIRANTRYNEWRLAVFKRDEFRDWFSGVCGRDNVQVHHIIPMSKILKENNIKTITDAINCELLWDINNGVTMLTSNHYAYHDMWGGQ